MPTFSTMIDDKEIPALSYLFQIIRLLGPVKIIATLLGLLSGAGILGVLSEYAAYNYAIQCGMRPPLEGIPYLRASITAGGFILLSICIIFFMAFGGILYIAESWISKFIILIANSLRISKKNKRLEKKELPDLLNKKSMSKAASIIVTLLAMFFGAATVFLLDSFSLRAFGFPAKFFLLPICIFMCCIGLAIGKRYPVWWISLVCTAIFLIGLTVSLFRADVYASLLRLVGYGGGIKITVDQIDKRQSEFAFLLRTTECILVRDPIKEVIIEIPLRNINSISHGSGGLHRLPFFQPTER